MMHLFFGWLLGVETFERPVVNDVVEQLGTIALHCGNDEAGAIGDNCSTLGSTLGWWRWLLKHARRRSQRCCRRQGRSDARW